MVASLLYTERGRLQQKGPTNNNDDDNNNNNNNNNKSKVVS